MATPNLSYCAAEVRRTDRDRFLTALFAPAAQREDLFALYAFNLEIAKTAEIVSEPMLGHIRLQWWREALDGIYSGDKAGKPPRHHAVIQPLTQAVARHGLSRDHFDAIIAARAYDLESEAPLDLAALESYVAATSVRVTDLALEVLGVGGADVKSAGHHTGMAWALAGLLLAIPFHARQQRCYLPRDLTQAAGLSDSALFALQPSPELCRLVEQVAARAAEHLIKARALRRQVPKAARSALLPATLAEGKLRRLRAAGYDPFAPVLQKPTPGNIWRLAWAEISGRY